MALRDMTSALNNPGTKVDNATLNRYFAENIPVEKERTTLISEEVLSNLDAILDYVHHQDEHYGRTGVRVGSSTQGLNVNVKGDIDCNVVFKLNPQDSDDSPSNKLNWTDNYKGPIRRFYGFEDPTQNDTSSLSDDLKIVQTPLRSLPNPEPGYARSGGFDHNSGLKEFLFNGDLIPFLVKRKFKHLLLEACEELGLKDDMKLSRISHGPALTFKAEVKTSHGETHPVSVDLAVVIRARLPFLLEMGWPVSSASWPSKDKIESIMRMGINQVAKKPFDWQLSFSELEKELVSEVDKDGGCRKTVHRIMKSVFYTVCKEDAALSTYMLKNAWFLEMEKYADPYWWQKELLADRYYGCLDSLRMYVLDGRLPQYFNRQINLLKIDKISEIQNDVGKILNFSFDTVNKRKRPSNTPTAPQPLKKSLWR